MLLFLLSLVSLQQMLAWMGDSSFYKRQREMIIKEDMDPAVFFYTERKHALKAEKEVRKRISQPVNITNCE